MGSGTVPAMDADAERIERLERLLRDERRLRDAAERKAATQATNARTWRERAEARAARIARLEAERDHLKTVRGFTRARLGKALEPVRGGAPTPAVPATSPVPSTTRGGRPPGLPTVQAAGIVDGVDLRRILAEATATDLRDDPAGFFEADVVVVEASALAAAPTEIGERFAEWVDLEARQPLVWVGDRPPPGDTLALAAADVPVTLDPDTDRPIRRPGEPPDEPTTIASLDAFNATDRDHVTAAARAEAVSGEPDPVAAGDLLRRHAWAHHAPAPIAAGLFAEAGVAFEDPTPEVAAMLVSNRPDDLRRQLGAVTAQRHPRLRLVVGCHGFPAVEVADAIAAAETLVPVDVHELPASETLGWCLNRTLEGIGSAVVAKIDDDDHYGPGYLTDALQAMDYAQAGVIGRVGSFTYLEGEDRTILRRVGDEEMYYDGTLIGATLVFRRSIWERSPFPHKSLAEDVGFQRGARALGERVYVASRWDFVYRRRVAGNTWRAPDEHFLAHHRPAWDGWQPERADLPAWPA